MLGSTVKEVTLSPPLPQTSVLLDTTALQEVCSKSNVTKETTKMPLNSLSVQPAQLTNTASIPTPLKTVKQVTTAQEVTRRKPVSQENTAKQPLLEMSLQLVTHAQLEELVRTLPQPLTLRSALLDTSVLLAQSVQSLRTSPTEVEGVLSEISAQKDPLQKPLAHLENTVTE